MTAPAGLSIFVKDNTPSNRIADGVRVLSIRWRGDNEKSHDTFRYVLGYAIQSAQRSVGGPVLLLGMTIGRVDDWMQMNVRCQLTDGPLVQVGDMAQALGIGAGVGGPVVDVPLSQRRGVREIVL